MQNPKKKKFRIEKTIKIKDEKIYVKWKGYGNSFDSSIDKIDAVI